MSNGGHLHSSIFRKARLVILAISGLLSLLWTSLWILGQFRYDGLGWHEFRRVHVPTVIATGPDEGPFGRYSGAIVFNTKHSISFSLLWSDPYPEGADAVLVSRRSSFGHSSGSIRNLQDREPKVYWQSLVDWRLGPIGLTRGGRQGTEYRSLRLPHGLLVLGTGFPLAWALWSTLVAHRRRKRSCCAPCGHSLEALPNDAVCPECGSQR